MIAPLGQYRKEVLALRKYYLSLPKEKRFSYIGVDVEYGYLQPHFVIKEKLKKYKKALLDTLSFLDKEELRGLVNWILEKENPYQWGNKYVREDVEKFGFWMQNEDSVILKSVLSKSDYHYVKKLLNAYNLGKGDRLFSNRQSDEYDFSREMYLAKNIYNAFLNDTGSYYYGRFGISHVRLNFMDDIKKTSKNLSMAYWLNNSDTLFSLTNNNIYSNIIYYNAHNKIYVFLKERKLQLDANLKKLRKCQLAFVPLKPLSVCNNLILFKD